MKKRTMSLREYLDHALQEVYSLEEMLDSFGQRQLADVLRSVIEMAYSKLGHAENIIDRDLGRIEFRLDEFGEAAQALLAGKPHDESIH